MTLINCPDCNQEFSDLAHACPRCGRPKEKEPAKQEAANREPGIRERIFTFGVVVLFLSLCGLIALLTSKPSVYCDIDKLKMSETEEVYEIPPYSGHLYKEYECNNGHKKTVKD
jgi:hypothetical protein